MILQLGLVFVLGWGSGGGGCFFGWFLFAVWCFWLLFFFFTDAAVKTETLNNHQERKLCIHRDRPLHTSFYFCDPNAFIYLKYFPLTVVFLTHCLHTKHPKANTQI